MRNVIDRLLIRHDLTRSESQRLFKRLFSSELDPNAAKQSLVLLQKKGIHPDELTGLVRAVRQFERPIQVRGISNAIDGCGTGGDGASTINISTLSCLVAAAGGAVMAKHGNRGISSRSGSADLLEALGVKIVASRARMLKALELCRFGYFHAPLYHPAFRKVQTLRRELAGKKIRTAFNLIGPLVNPLRINRQAIGVFRKDLLPIFGETLRKLKTKRALIFWNHDGVDELTTTAPSAILEIKNNRLTRGTLDPKTFGFRRGKLQELKGGDVRRNCRLALEILNGRGNPTSRDTVSLNAAALLYLGGQVKSIREGIGVAQNVLKSGAALKTLKQLIAISHGT